MNTKTICKELNISQKALRIYEEQIIVVPKRDGNNYRNYSPDDVLKLRQVLLLRKMDIPLKNIKLLLAKEFNDNKIIRGLDLQLKVVDNRIMELENIKETLFHSINDVLLSKEDTNYAQYFDKVSACLYQNMESRKKWTDKWSFDSWAKNYDNSIQEVVGDGLNLFESYDDVLNTVVKRISANNAVKVLDIGCGTGNLYDKIKDDIMDFTGIDQSIEMLLQARKKYPNIKIRIGNFLDEPFIVNEFDTMVSTYAFHHLSPDEKEKSINLILRYLKTGGKMVIADLMFLNEVERQKQKEHFCNSGREDLWKIVEDEYYTDIQKTKSYAELLGCKVSYEHIVNFTWILEIEK